jgi:multicomponent Na+:H+ antiporter subunit D
MPAVLVLYMVGAVSISGLPLFNGFISKTMTITAAEHAGVIPAYLLLELASVGTFLSVGLKLPYFTWYGTPKELPLKSAPRNMFLGMGLAAAACLLLGVAPGLLYRYLPFPVHYEPFAPAHLIGTLQLLFFAGVVFFFLIPKLSPKPGFLVDTDYAYRMPAPLARRIFVRWIVTAFESVQIAADGAAAALARRGKNPVAALSRFFGRPVDPAQDFDPDRQRPPMQAAITLTLLFAVAMALWIVLRP